MSDLTQLATGILPASGYKAGVVYGIVPENPETIGLLKNAFDFTSTRNGPANRTNSDGLLEEMANDVCRVDYSGGGCPHLLLEPASTNLFLNSDVAVDQIIAGLTVSQAYTITFYEGEGDIDVSSIGGGPTQAGVPFTFNASSNSHFFTITGTCNKVQVENLGYATSYISTLGTSVTRPQDALIQAVPNSDMYNSEEGVLMVEVATIDTTLINNHVAFLTVGSTPNQNLHNILFRVGNRIRYSSFIGGVAQTNIDFTGIDQFAFNKIAMRYNSSVRQLWLNGVNVGETPSSPMAANTLNNLYIGYPTTNNFRGKVNQVAYFPSFLTDEEMIQLTT